MKFVNRKIGYTIDAIQIEKKVDQNDIKYSKGTYIFWDPVYDELVYMGKDAFREKFVEQDVPRYKITDCEEDEINILFDYLNLEADDIFKIGRRLKLNSKDDLLSMKTKEISRLYYNRAKEQNKLGLLKFEIDHIKNIET